jgi:hypothetical protein
VLLLFCVFIVGYGYRTIVEIDIRSGRVRECVAVYGLSFGCEVQETVFSRFVDDNLSRDVHSPAWRTDTVQYSWIRRKLSPHFSYHGTRQSMRTLFQAFEVNEAPKTRRKELVQQALTMMAVGKSFEVESQSGEINLVCR